MHADPPSLDRLFNPRTVAVVGASASPAKAGYQMMKSLVGGTVHVYPINPNAAEILGVRAFPDLAAVPEPIDLVVLTIPAVACVPALKQAAAVGAGAALIVSGGFADVGGEGKRLQDELASICRSGRIRLLGPNTSGYFNPVAGLRASFVPGTESFHAGDIAIVAQSGGINVALALLAARDGIGLSLAVGLGNAADVDAADVIAHLARDPATRAIAVHLEGISDGRHLYETVRAAARLKPVIALPVGRTAIGDFARSHTGELLGNFALTRAALAQAGAVIVESLSDLIDAAVCLAARRLEPARRAGVGVITGQAGPGLLIADTLNAAGVSVPPLATSTVEKIAKLLPPLTYTRNPVDTGRPGESFRSVVEAVAADPAIDAVLVYAIHEPEAMDPVAILGHARNSLAMPIVFGTGAAPASAWAAIRAVRAAGIPCFVSPDQAARAMRALVADAAAQDRIRSSPPAPVAAERPLAHRPLDEAAAKDLIDAAGISTPRRAACATRAEAHVAFNALRRPVVVKILDARIAHKSEIGGVVVGVETSEQLERALAQIDSNSGRIDAIPHRPHRYLVEEMAPPGLELILGAKRDSSFGPSVLVGLGGITAEALGDVAVRLAPLAARDAEEMLDELRARKLLDGWRGSPAVNRAKLVAAIVALGRFVAAHPEIRELDINPVRAYPDGLLALDALIVM